MNTKDEVYFHNTLSTIRQLRNVSLEQLSQGLYDVSMMQRIEKGERLPEKLMRDRIMARLGVSEELYEDYLFPKEYHSWCMRRDILTCVENKDFDKLELYLKEYKNLKKICSVEKQFYETIQFWLYKKAGVSLAKQRGTLQLAMKYTMPKYINKIPVNILLADQELNLLIEYIFIREYKGKSENELIWRIKQYKKVLDYIERAKLDEIGKAKIYPKAVYYLSKTITLNHGTQEQLKYGLDMCNRAIEMLRDAQKMYYLIELFEQKENFLEQIMESFAEDSQERKRTEFLSDLAEVKSWKKVLIELYRENNLSPYMENDCYIYWERNSYAIGDMIKIRRNMFGMTREQLCDGICDKRTLMRLELNQMKTQMPIVRKLFERLGLCPDYIRGKIVTLDIETLRIVEKAAHYANNYEMVEWEKALNELEKRLNLELAYNRQVFMRMKTSLMFCKKELSKEDCVKNLIKALECTLPPDAFLEEEIYLTKEEISCIYNIAIRQKEEQESYYLDLWKKISEMYAKNKEVSAHISMYELILMEWASFLGDQGKYDESDETASMVLRESLRYRRMGNLPCNLYDIVWNYKQRMKEGLSCKQIYDVEDVLKKCVILADIVKRKNLLKFYKQELIDA